MLTQMYVGGVMACTHECTSEQPYLADVPISSSQLHTEPSDSPGIRGFRGEVADVETRALRCLPVYAEVDEAATIGQKRREDVHFGWPGGASGERGAAS
jgi:hypothetical protein